MRRVGIFGGSFDPVHAGHILIAGMAARQFKLERIVFVPARRSPHKRRSVFAPAEHRLAMVKAAVRGHRQFTWSDSELRRTGLSFTIDTLEFFQKEYPSARLYLLLGSDNIRSFRTWKDPERIRAMAHILVYQRWGHEVTPKMLSRWDASLLKGPEIFISSTAIRLRRASGKTIRHFVPPAVERYILRHSLYQRSKHRD